jgi:EAL domain-containing protein (putative c-di-GMP-specific phosphodiesterase class I)
VREVRLAIQAILAERSFHPVFQPIVELADRRIVGYEALTRFDDETAPDVRFAQAAHVGLGIELEMATLGAAMDGASRLTGDGWLDLNASPSLILDGSRLRAAMAGAGRPLVLEVTEHAVIDDYAALRGAIDALGPAARLAVDDAGAGFASLRHIVELRPDFVKLDRSLVADIDGDPGRQAIVAGMRHFALATGCRLIAEGIETEAELATLRSLEIELGQGYLLGRPEPPPD